MEKDSYVINVINFVESCVLASWQGSEHSSWTVHSNTSIQ